MTEPTHNETICTAIAAAIESLELAQSALDLATVGWPAKSLAAGYLSQAIGNAEAAKKIRSHIVGKESS